jgi:hypothetical protein
MSFPENPNPLTGKGDIHSRPQIGDSTISKTTISPSSGFTHYIKFDKQSDYEKKKSGIKRLIKVKHKLSKFNFGKGEWHGEDKNKVVKRTVDNGGNTSGLLFKGVPDLVVEMEAYLKKILVPYVITDISLDQESEGLEVQESTAPVIAPAPP